MNIFLIIRVSFLQGKEVALITFTEINLWRPENVYGRTEGSSGSFILLYFLTIFKS